VLTLVLLLGLGPGFAEEAVDPAYLKVVTERAAKIVGKLSLDNAATAARVTDLIAGQYVQLSAIHDARDAAIRAARVEAGEDKDALIAVTENAVNLADAKIYRLHAAFVARLSVELTPEQVDGVKDGMTYGVAQGTYNVYMKMFPDLTNSQKNQVRAWLLEARELAMDQGSSEEKHKVFGKYKGKINNFLVKAGYDLKKGEENLR